MMFCRPYFRASEEVFNVFSVYFLPGDDLLMDNIKCKRLAIKSSIFHMQNGAFLILILYTTLSFLRLGREYNCD